MTILIMGINPFSHNRGLAAMSMGMIDLLTSHYPTEKLVIVPFYSYSIPQASFFDERYKEDNNIKLIEISDNSIIFLLKLIIRSYVCVIWRLLKCIKVDISKILLQDEILRAYMETDIVISHNAGDRLTDQRPYSYFLVVFHEHLIPIIFGKKIILSPQTIGPFGNPVTCTLGKFILRNVRLICVREQYSKEYIKKMGIKEQKIFLIPDIAFIFPPAPSECVDDVLRENGIDPNTTQRLVGVSLRHLVKHQYRKIQEHQRYVEIIAKTMDYLIEKYDVRFLIIPQVGMKRPNRNLEEVTDDVISKVKNKDRVCSIRKKEYPAEVLKGIIKKCDLFIGTFMHANIAALSMCVPTVALSYGYKFKGIMKMMGQERYVLSLDNLTFENIISKVENAWSCREKIRAELEMKMYDIKGRVFFTGELIKKGAELDAE